MFVSLLIGLKIPLLAIQILWINLVTDGLPAVALGFEPPERDVMHRKPRPRDETVLAGGVGRHIVSFGILIAFLTLAAYAWGYVKYDMEPFSPSLGIERMSAQELGGIVGEQHIPADWESLSAEERIAKYLQDESRSTAQEESSEGLIALAERLPRTLAFTVLALTQMFEVIAIHAGNRASFFKIWFSHNRILLFAVLSSTLLQLAVVYVPFLQHTFETLPLDPEEIIGAALIASVVLFVGEAEKLVNRRHTDEHLMGAPA
jgi:Ca2+-transporting ATPase